MYRSWSSTENRLAGLLVLCFAVVDAHYVVGVSTRSPSSTSADTDVTNTARVAPPPPPAAMDGVDAAHAESFLAVVAHHNDSAVWHRKMNLSTAAFKAANKCCNHRCAHSPECHSGHGCLHCFMG